ncbi:hypothetical protein HYPSUDRAFT_60309, partial [Hypholoma sublateritium FD-334 SS-4]
MRLRPLNTLKLLAPAPVLAAQALFASMPTPGGNWSLAHAPPANMMGHLIFDTVRLLLQHWLNTRYRNADDAEEEVDGGCYHLTLAVTCALKVLYFDGSSAAKMRGRPMDSQDLVASRMGRALCEWAAPLGVDGFVRMEMDFEIMLCNFTVSVKVISFLNLAAPAERR